MTAEKKETAPKETTRKRPKVPATIDPKVKDPGKEIEKLQAWRGEVIKVSYKGWLLREDISCTMCDAIREKEDRVARQCLQALLESCHFQADKRILSGFEYHDIYKALAAFNDVLQTDDFDRTATWNQAFRIHNLIREVVERSVYKIK